ncbi:MAG: Npun_F0813 family protein [Xenococcaceae cyanobacterium]
MNEKIPVLDLKNVQLCFLDNPSNGGQVSMMHYEGITFRPLSVFFNIACQQNAQIFCKNFSVIYGKQCVLLQKNNEYSVWIEINQQKYVANKHDRDSSSSFEEITTKVKQSKQQESIFSPANESKSLAREFQTSSIDLQKIAFEKERAKRQNIPQKLDRQETPPSKNERDTSQDRTSDRTLQPSNMQVFLLLIQIISEDVEYLMGERKKVAFCQEISYILEQSWVFSSKKSGSIHYLLFLNPMQTKNLPNLREEYIEQLFDRLGYLCIKYFGNTKFLDRALDLLQEMPIYSNERVLSLCLKFVLICKNLEKK